MYQEIPKLTASSPTKINESGMLPFKLSEILFNLSPLFGGVFIISFIFFIFPQEDR